MILHFYKRFNDEGNTIIRTTYQMQLSHLCVYFNT